MDALMDRIIIDENICNGKPIIRGYRLTVQTVLEFLFSGTPEEEILRQYPFLEQEDIEACKQFALKMMDQKYSLKGMAA
jgi:uncharacterized protein (DUF433 family)